MKPINSTLEFFTYNKSKKVVKNNYLSGTDDDVVDRNKDKLHKEANESHYYKPDRGANSHFREFYKQ